MREVFKIVVLNPESGAAEAELRVAGHEVVGAKCKAGHARIEVGIEAIEAGIAVVEAGIARGIVRVAVSEALIVKGDAPIS